MKIVPNKRWILNNSTIKKNRLIFTYPVRVVPQLIEAAIKVGHVILTITMTPIVSV